MRFKQTVEIRSVFLPGAEGSGLIRVRRYAIFINRVSYPVYPSPEVYGERRTTQQMREGKVFEREEKTYSDPTMGEKRTVELTYPNAILQLLTGGDWSYSKENGDLELCTP